MSDIDEAPGDERTEIVDVDVRAWVEAAKTDVVRYRDRQVTEIVLAAIGIAPNLKQALLAGFWRRHLPCRVAKTPSM